ncbi:MAG: PSD1 and planctomycete cytochrome C domain-containing protein [Planctomycetota bacterium]|nr:PSD1 and planctomycete cytochrome C domain-containing protein [Planctomycetota bacterium]
MSTSGRFLAFVLLWAGSSPRALVAERTGESVDFERQVAPLIAAHCLECHSEGQKKGGLLLISRKDLLAGGESGAAITPGKPDDSLLVERLRAGEMPPREKGKSRRLRDTEIAILEAWIRAGAAWPEGRRLSPYEVTTSRRGGLDWWSFQPVKRPAVPDVVGADGARQPAHPVDAFVLARLAEAGLAMAPPADRRTLIRRATFDLLGLPPAPRDVRAFVADDSEEAYEQLIDRLLASPRHGERWGRYWLDLVRFAETNGYERDATKPGAWKYRDWVIRAINDDKPYDRFVTEQLAGDELPDRSEETVTATGFLRLGTWNDEPNDPAEYKYERLEDLVHTTSSAFLAITVKCARCHDHKFDPVPQVDYYELASVFWAGFVEPRDRKLMGGPSAQELGHDVLGWTDRGRAVPPFHLLHKGDPRRPGPVVAPGFLALAPALQRPFLSPPESSRTTHRRSQLAAWITDARNPLTARVLVNRLWQHHFGSGLVRTPNNFGFKGDRPTHPALLDWLASELVDGGWQIKRLHKLLMTSRTYRQASSHPREEVYEEKDFANTLLWRANRRRLDAEALRDAMLAVSGRLNPRLGGPSFYPRIAKEALEGLSRKGQTWGSSPPEERGRRSVYIFAKRSLLVPFLTTFDFCDTTRPCGKRDVTTVAPQALALLNNPFAHETSEAFARRIASERADQPSRVVRAWELAFGRRPGTGESEAARLHLAEQERHFERRLGVGDETARAMNPEHLALASLCLVLLNANEFIYAD